MFIKGLDPSPGVFSDARQYQYCPSPETASAFRFSVAKPCLFSNECCIDRYYVYSPTQNPPQSFDPQTEKMNHISRASVPTPDQSSRPVSLQPSTTGIRAGGQHLEGFSPNYFGPGTMPALTSTAGTTRDSRLVHGLPSSTPDWFNNPTASAGDGSSGQYGPYGGATDSLYYGTPNHSSSHFDLGAASGGGAMPNCFESSSSSTYPMNSSSPNTIFGSFSSSVEFGPPGNMDVDMDMDMDIGLTNQFIHSSSSLADAMASGEFFKVEPSTQRQNIMNNNPPTPMFPTSPNPGTTMEPHMQTTVSPSMLRLNNNSNNNTPSLPVAFSSESLSGSYSPFHMDTDTSAVIQGTANNTVPESLILPSSDRSKTSSRKSQRGANSVSISSSSNSKSSRWGRKALPDKAPIPQFILPNNGQTRRSEPLPVNSVSSPKSHSKKSNSKSKSKTKTPSQSKSQSYLTHTMDFTSTPSDARAAALSSSAAVAPADVAGGNPHVPSTERSAQDEFLVSSRLGGMKYSQIRKLGNFKEAESTLRGRFRTLVKPKEARVRNPQWQEIDDRLLKQAVPRFSKSTDNIPWKVVADYIYNNGGTYQFGYNTCHKRWKYLKETTQTGGEPMKRERTRHGKKDV